jgi:MraZ protein
VIGSSSAGVVTLGAHESDPCLTAYEPGHAPVLQAELERRRLRDEAAGAGTDKHHMRARRAFGFVEDAEVEGDRLALPPMMRMRGRIGELVLFVGTGATFEIWNPEVALEEGDEGLRELAGYRLGQRNTPGREKAR